MASMRAGVRCPLSHAPALSRPQLTRAAVADQHQLEGGHALGRDLAWESLLGEREREREEESVSEAAFPVLSLKDRRGRAARR